MIWVLDMLHSCSISCRIGDILRQERLIIGSSSISPIAIQYSLSLDLRNWENARHNKMMGFAGAQPILQLHGARANRAESGALIWDG